MIELKKSREEIAELHQIFHDESGLLISLEIDKALRKILEKHTQEQIALLEAVKAWAEENKVKHHKSFLPIELVDLIKLEDLTKNLDGLISKYK